MNLCMATGSRLLLKTIVRLHIGAILLLHQKVAIAPHPNIWWTRDQSVNSSLSIVVQKKKPIALYLSRFSRGGPTKFESTFFQIAKLKFLTIFADFRQNSRIFKNSQGMSEEASGLKFWNLDHHIRI